ncbi:2-oxoacid:acceptor oxidoreductase subunit alpha [Candidatus Woesebacteria bacterium]|nr:2-oxoacid:acceptor oxidoreductase subunit alpha [Candidatus Woesebacteria bacterium]
MSGPKTISIKVGGQAGQGIKAAGQLLAKTATRSGYNIFTYTEFPSIIRGGHNVTQVMISRDEVTAATRMCDVLIALDQDTIDKHKDEIKNDGIVIYEGEKKIDTSDLKKSVKLCPIPLSKFAQEAGSNELLKNTAAIGAVMALLNGDLKILFNLLKDEFGSKGEEIVKANQKAAELGYDHAKKEYAKYIERLLEKKDNIEKKMVLSGNTAAGLGAIAGGVQFSAIYPMSPISGVLHTLAKYQEKYGYVYKQPEDEISAINMSIGAAHAGARALTSTSGGGFALMAEGYGLAGITETPVVIIEGMRPGPGTGLPTWSGQGDLQFILHAPQGDFPRIVLAAGDIKETFYLTMKALNLAEKYQTTVVVIIDKNLCDGDQSYPVFDISDFEVDRGKLTREKVEGIKRYQLSDDGISPRTTPGTGNFFIANSDEHDEEGLSSEESDNANAQQAKRMQKLITCANEDMEEPTLYGPEEADVTIVSWGSNKGSILATLKDFLNVNFLHITWMNPFPTERVKSVLSKAKYVIDMEANLTGQLANLIAEKTGIIIADRFLKVDGRPYYPEEIKDKLESVLNR